jgi:hypothetical protein
MSMTWTPPVVVVAVSAYAEMLAHSADVTANDAARVR